MHVVVAVVLNVDLICLCDPLLIVHINNVNLHDSNKFERKRRSAEISYNIPL